MMVFLLMKSLGEIAHKVPRTSEYRLRFFLLVPLSDVHGMVAPRIFKNPKMYCRLRIELLIYFPTNSMRRGR